RDRIRVDLAQRDLVTSVPVARLLAGLVVECLEQRARLPPPQREQWLEGGANVGRGALVVDDAPARGVELVLLHARRQSEGAGLRIGAHGLDPGGPPGRPGDAR